MRTNRCTRVRHTTTAGSELVERRPERGGGVGPRRGRDPHAAAGARGGPGAVPVGRDRLSPPSARAAPRPAPRGGALYPDRMRVLLSWSGERSKAVAIALRRWLPRVLQASEPWMSEHDIKAGQQWANEIGTRLASTSFLLRYRVPGDQQACPARSRRGLVLGLLARRAGGLARHRRTRVVPGEAARRRTSRAARTGRACGAPTATKHRRRRHCS
jgi:hypothetical protein